MIFSLLKLSLKKFSLSTISEDIFFHIKIGFGMKERRGIVRVLIETRKVLAKIRLIRKAIICFFERHFLQNHYAFIDLLPWLHTIFQSREMDSIAHHYFRHMISLLNTGID